MCADLVELVPTPEIAAMALKITPILRPLILVIPCLSLEQKPTHAQGLEYVKAHYTKHEYRIPMRDGVKLFTHLTELVNGKKNSELTEAAYTLRKVEDSAFSKP